MAIPFELPEFLNEDEETIHQRMRQNAPPDVNTEEGDIFYDVTRPVAIETSEMKQMKLAEAIKVAFPQWSYGIYLDMLAEMEGLQRHPAVNASGEVVFTGVPGTIIPAGTVVATVSDGENPSIEFQTMVQAEIEADGTVTAAIEAVEAGPIGNVASNQITILATPINGVSSVTNPAPTSGGTPAEDDDSLRERIIESRKYPHLSGSRLDYERWAREVPGVGQAYCFPEWNGAGTVKVVIIDSNGEPANQALLDEVQSYIAPDERNGGGLAPIGHFVTVAAPITKVIDVSVSLVLESGYDQLQVVEAIKQEIKQLFMSMSIGETVRIAEIGAVIIQTEGVQDYSNLLLNGSAQNVVLQPDEVPVLGMVTVT